ncbi:MAG: hypothetical protein JWN25_2539, partial [Verrucomicrobiales bacterium]|nr:hypothetical protein [Verrucomicrobiales bacterium]
MAASVEHLNTATSQRVLAALKEAQSRIRQLEQPRREPIAIVGMGCRFPGGDSPDEFWNSLKNGVDAVIPVPADRWDVEKYYKTGPKTAGYMYCNSGGFLGDVAGFDPGFFNIAPKEAAYIDPQHRLLLEVAWEALEDAGFSRQSLIGSDIGVFVGITTCDYSRIMLAGGVEQINGYLNTGSANNAAAGRISYTFGLQGPALAVDTACSSSLVALHLGCQSLRARECGAVVVAGVNLILSPENFIAACQAGMLAPDGKCKTFDASANGYGRGEGCGAVILKRLSDAEAGNDRILAVIRGSAMNQDGQSGGLTVPNGPAQAELIRRCLLDAGLTVDEIDYVEAHGTGTSLGDPIELRALGQVFKDKSKPLLVGSVKTNIGHLESASGMAGLFKLLLAFENNLLPAHLHFSKKNPHVDWEVLNLKIPVTASTWLEDKKRAGISSFGGSGTNAHVIVENWKNEDHSHVPREFYLFKLSARTEWSLKTRVRKFVTQLQSDTPWSLADVCYTCTFWSDFEYRFAVVVSSTMDLLDQLQKFVGNEEVHLPFIEDGKKSEMAGSRSRELMACIQTEITDKRLLDFLAADYLAGARIDWKALRRSQPGNRVRLPGYAFQRERYWVDSPVHECEMNFRNRRIHNAANRDLEVYESRLGAKSAWYVGQHQVEGQLLVPAATWVEMMITCSSKPGEEGSNVLENFKIIAPLELSGTKVETVQLVIQAGAGQARRLELFRQLGEGENWALVASAESKKVLERVTHKLESWASVSKNCHESISVEDFYATLREAGVNYGQAFKRLKSIRKGNAEAAGEVLIAAQELPEYESYYSHPVLLDCCFQTVAAALDKQNLRGRLQSGIIRLRILKKIPLHFYTHAKIVSESLSTILANIQLWDLEGNQLAVIEGLELRKSVSAASSIQNWFYRMEWHPIETAPSPGEWRKMANHMDIRSIEDPEKGMNGRLESYETSAVRFVQNAFIKLGWQHSKEIFTLDSIQELLRVKPNHRLFLGRLMEILTISGFFEKISAGWRQNLDLKMEVVATHDHTSPEWTVFARCGSQLAEVLRGEQNPLELLFPAPVEVGVGEIYRDAAGAHIVNEIACRAVEQALHYLGMKVDNLKVLEIGGGTGGTTASILQSLPNGTDYLFTDISRALVSDACEKFNNFGIRGAVLNIEQSPLSQGVHEQFDLIIAANVIHATRSIQASIQHVKSLLRPGGFLILIEATTPRFWSDLIMGMTEGWWLFEDHVIRKSHCLLSESGWAEILAVSGFEAPLIFKSDLDSVRLLSDFKVIVTKQAEPCLSRGKNLWVLVGNGGDLTHKLEKKLKSHDQSVTLMEWNSDIDASLAMESFQMLAKEWEKLHIIYLEGVAVANPNEFSSDAKLKETLKRTCGGALKLVQAVIPLPRAPRLIFLTSGAVAAKATEKPSVVLAALGGLVKVIAHEHPEFKSLHLDLENGAENLDQIMEAMEGTASPIALREGGLLGNRLCQVNDFPQAMKFNPLATYLITGGLGGMGYAIAEWMITCGAQNLVLLGRNAPGEETSNKINDLRLIGANVVVIAADVSNRKELQKVLDEIEGTLPPIKGIVHAAGVFEDRLLRDHQWDLFEKVFDAKILGSWNLHLLTAQLDLDFFVMTSSASALFGAPGMGNYVAASCFQDSLGMLRKAEGKVGLSINMGLWDETGMSISVGTQRREQYENYGVRAMPPSLALKGLGSLLSQSGHIGMMDIEW